MSKTIYVGYISHNLAGLEGREEFTNFRKAQRVTKAKQIEAGFGWIAKIECDGVVVSKRLYNENWKAG